MEIGGQRVQGIRNARMNNVIRQGRNVSKTRKKKNWFYIQIYLEFLDWFYLNFHLSLCIIFRPSYLLIWWQEYQSDNDWILSRVVCYHVSTTVRSVGKEKIAAEPREQMSEEYAQRFGTYTKKCRKEAKEIDVTYICMSGQVWTTLGRLYFSPNM